VIWAKTERAFRRRKARSNLSSHSIPRDESGEFSAHLGVLGIVGKVMLLVGIAMHVEEHGPVCGLLTELDVAPILGSDGGTVHGLSIFAPDAAEP